MPRLFNEDSRLAVFKLAIFIKLKTAQYICETKLFAEHRDVKRNAIP